VSRYHIYGTNIEWKPVHEHPNRAFDAQLSPAFDLTMTDSGCNTILSFKDFRSPIN
jgi:hypothetical protein